MIVYYKNTLRYANLHDDKDMSRTYGKGVVSVSVKEVFPYAVYISDDVNLNAGMSHQA